VPNVPKSLRRNTPKATWALPLAYWHDEIVRAREQLQSTNEELQTMNDELRLRSDELNSVNSFLESILTSLRGVVVVVDAELKVLVWNQGAEELWGLREDEVRGKHVLGLDTGLPIEKLKQPMRSCLNGTKPHTSVTLDAVNRRGRPIVCHVTVTPLLTRARTIHGVIMVMDDQSTTTANGRSTTNNSENGASKKRKKASTE